MKVTSFVLTCACITAALLVGSATEASAKGKKLPDMSASALKGACAKSGAAYGPSDGGGGVCMFGSGDYVICDKNNHCKGYTAKAVLPTSKNDDAIATTGNAQQKGNYDLSAGNAEPKTSIDPGAGVKAEVLGSATASAKFGS